MKKKENILIIKHGALGDLIQADGIFKSIRAKHKYAKIVLINKEICIIETPKIAGPIKLNILQTPLSFISKLNFGKQPICFKKGIWKNNCKTPPKNTAQAKTLIGSSKKSEKYNAEIINQILSQTGVNAGTMNFP